MVLTVVFVTLTFPLTGLRLGEPSEGRRRREGAGRAAVMLGNSTVDELPGMLTPNIVCRILCGKGFVSPLKNY